MESAFFLFLYDHSLIYRGRYWSAQIDDISFAKHRSYECALCLYYVQNTLHASKPIKIKHLSLVYPYVLVSWGIADLMDQNKTFARAGARTLDR
jgi:hypothetical protein